MATNHYFNHYGTNTADQRLIESIIIESIKVYGIDLHYMPRTLVNEDKLFGEDRISQFNDSRIIEMYIKNVGYVEWIHAAMWEGIVQCEGVLERVI